MTNSKIEQMIRKLVSRFFKQSDESKELIQQITRGLTL